MKYNFTRNWVDPFSFCVGKKKDVEEKTSFTLFFQHPTTKKNAENETFNYPKRMQTGELFLGTIIKKHVRCICKNFYNVCLIMYLWYILLLWKPNVMGKKILFSLTVLIF